MFLAHYVATNIYASVCAPASFSGFIQSLLMTGSPVCNLALNVMHYTSDGYSIAVATAAFALLSHFSSRFRTPAPVTRTQTKQRR